MNRLIGVFLGLLVLLLLWCGFQLGWFEAAGERIDDSIIAFCDWWKARFGVNSVLAEPFMVHGLLGSVLASLICGVISSLVVSNRMAFFSDALAHCAFAGVSLGLILYLAGFLTDDAGILGMTVLFGVLVGVAIAYVRERTSLANDTVIGVFFAAAMGLGAVLLKAVSRLGIRGFDPENFLFGDILTISGKDLINLALLIVGMVVFLWWLYNRLVFASFNPSLARSRNFPVRLGSYLFIVLLALIINVCLKVVGALLINALLIIPGATACILARNLRQFFWLSTLVAVAAGLGGLWLSYSWTPELGGHRVDLVSGGSIVIVGAGLFFGAMVVGRWVRGQRPAGRTGF